jgi:Na+-transporting NADH:ubiquinone oxidoreductase subunit C
MRIVDLATGQYTTDIDPATFDPLNAARDPELGMAIPPDKDIAGLKRRSKFALVYLVMEGQDVRYIILPVSGYGLWSTMYGYLALESDATRIVGLRFYQHAETPGLGAEIDNPNWVAQWPGKYVYDRKGNPAIEVIRGKVATDSVTRASPRRGDPRYQVDGLAGATLTGNGVTYMLHYWLGTDGYGPYLTRLWEERG